MTVYSAKRPTVTPVKPVKKRDNPIKREPLLADMLLATPEKDLLRPLPKNLIPRLKDELLTAKRWVFDQDASGFLGETISKVPEAIAYAQEFAIPPFEKMWVEYTTAPLIKAITAGRSQGPQFPPEKQDTRIAYFYVGPNVYVFAESEHKVGMLPLCYCLNQPHDLSEEKDFAHVLGVSRMQLDLFYWGKVADDFFNGQSETPAFDKTCLTMLRANHAARWLPGGYKEALRAAPARVKDNFIIGGAGDLRNIVAIPLLLNRSSKTLHEEVLGPKQQMVFNKAKTLVGHSIIRFKLNPVPHLMQILPGAGGAWRRRHDVRGHFCMSKVAREAEATTCPLGLHNWHEYGVNQWRCMQCSGLKWWRKEHARGHLDKGIVISEYDVGAT